MTMRNSLAFAATLTVLAASPAWAGAGHDHSPKHGGIVAEVKDVDFEFVLKADVIHVHVRGHKPVKLEGATAKLSLLNGSQKTEVPLTLVGDKFEAKGSFDVSKGTKGVAVITFAGMAPKTARFEVKK